MLIDNPLPERKREIKTIAMLVKGSPVLVKESVPITPVPCYDCRKFVKVKDCLSGWGGLQLCPDGC